ncbi:unnamed protein product [Parajaminaea phylloscopi]
MASRGALEVLQPPPLSLLPLQPRPENWLSSDGKPGKSGAYSSSPEDKLGAAMSLRLVRSRPSPAQTQPASLRRVASSSPAQRQTPTGMVAATGTEQAQSEAIAQLSITPPRPSSSPSVQALTSEDENNPFALYARAQRRRPSLPVAGSSPGATALRALAGHEDARTGRIRQALAPFRWLKPKSDLSSATATAASGRSRFRESQTDLVDRLNLDTGAGLAIDLGDASRSGEASPRDVVDAMSGLGWYWDSKAEAIWGRRAASPDGRVSDSERSRRRMVGETSTRRSSSSGRPAETSWSWRKYLEDYAAGAFDIDDPVASKPREKAATSQSPAATIPDYLRCPLPAWEGDRLAAICRSGVFQLPTAVLGKIDALAERLRAELSVKTVYVDVLFDDESYLVQQEGTICTKTRRQDTICSHTILNSQRGLTVLDRRQDWRFKDNPIIGHVGFYSGFPVRSGTGLPFGAVCVIDPNPREAFSEEQKRIVRDAADEVSRLVEGNYAEQFKTKMNALGAALDAVKASLSHIRQPTETSVTIAPERPVDFPSVGVCFAAPDFARISDGLATIRHSMQLDIVALMGISGSGSGAEPAANRLIASSGEPLPLEHDCAPGLYSGVVAEATPDWQTFQNSHFTKTQHPSLPFRSRVSDESYTCGFVLPMSLSSASTNGSTTCATCDDARADPHRHFALIVASTQARRVLGIEDLRFLQSISSSLQTALQRCLDASVDVRVTQLAHEIAAVHLPSRLAAHAEEEVRPQRVDDAGDASRLRVAEEATTQANSSAASDASLGVPDLLGPSMARSLSTPDDDARYRGGVTDARDLANGPVGSASRIWSTRSRDGGQSGSGSRPQHSGLKSPQMSDFYLRIGQKTAAVPVSVARKLASTTMSVAGSMRPGSSRGVGASRTSTSGTRPTSPLGLSYSSWSSSVDSLRLSPSLEATATPASGSGLAATKKGRLAAGVSAALSVDHLEGRHVAAKHLLCEQCLDDEVTQRSLDPDSPRSKVVRWASRRPSSSSLSTTASVGFPLPEGAGASKASDGASTRQSPSHLLPRQRSTRVTTRVTKAHGGIDGKDMLEGRIQPPVRPLHPQVTIPTDFTSRRSSQRRRLAELSVMDAAATETEEISDLSELMGGPLSGRPMSSSSRMSLSPTSPNSTLSETGAVGAASASWKSRLSSAAAAATTTSASSTSLSKSSVFAAPPLEGGLSPRPPRARAAKMSSASSTSGVTKARGPDAVPMTSSRSEAALPVSVGGTRAHSTSSRRDTPERSAAPEGAEAGVVANPPSTGLSPATTPGPVVDAVDAASATERSGTSPTRRPVTAGAVQP